MTKQEANRVLQKIYNLIKHEGWVVIFNSALQSQGYVDEDDHEIIINPRVAGLGTIVHEFLHIFIKPRSGESEAAYENRVSEAELELMERLSDRQLKNLYHRIGYILQV